MGTLFTVGFIGVLGVIALVTPSLNEESETMISLFITL